MADERFKTSDGLLWNHHPGWYFRSTDEGEVHVSAGAERVKNAHGDASWTPYVEVNGARVELQGEEEKEEALGSATEFLREMIVAARKVVGDDE